ncbi:MAG: glycoside hydrolase family 9 protein, partial [Cyclobacteriaceae bacterium]|nr:glycoside hydrolase family 9 protein [Cyclobacteriaceae bacterium]
TGQGVLRAKPIPSHADGWMDFRYFYTLDFSAVKGIGKYLLRSPYVLNNGQDIYLNIGAYPAFQEDLLGFMRQQRCGYNPFLDRTCHQQDGRVFYSPLPDSAYVDVSGGWHDAGDQLKYLITSSNATARMLLAFELEQNKFSDLSNELGQPYANGIPDVLDEAKWGLDWLLKMHPQNGHLYHQVADDRDHMGWKWPDSDPSDYGWGANSYRVAYFADGNPQGLGRYKSQATGIANLAGRSAAALAMGARIMEGFLPTGSIAIYREAAEDLYRMGRQKEGFQQGNSFGAPYRYNEITWQDDMEWAATELYRLTGETHYLTEAQLYAEAIGAEGLLIKDSAAHYEQYPFINVGHFALYPHVSKAFQEKLASYYRQGIEKSLLRARQNVFGAGVPFIWCSNNVTVGLITQIMLYEQMTGDRQYHSLMIANRDWLLGRNPWGTSMFMHIPAHAEYPRDVHTSTWALTHQEVPGGLVDGPIWRSIYDQLIGLELNRSDEFRDFQNDYIVYHDDIGDYSTNEPTMDGTADAILMMAAFSSEK